MRPARLSRRSTVTPSDSVAEPIGSTRLSAAESQQLLQAATATAPAPPCNQSATQIVGARFYRPDGSGGANLTIEIDGCQRLNIPRLTTIRTAPTPLLQQLDAKP